MSEKTGNRGSESGEVRYPFENAARPAPGSAKGACPAPPDDAQCFRLWDKYAMLENVRRHSLEVGRIATALAKRAFALGMNIDVDACRASALLHDIAKTWCIREGGSHAIIGASWIVQETRHYAVAQGALLHVHWPWELPKDQAICCLPIFVLYADKRVRHDRCVSLKERFDDLIARYGKTAQARAGIRKSFDQAARIESLLSAQLGWSINEDPFDWGRMVQRARDIP